MHLLRKHQLHITLRSTLPSRLAPMPKGSSQHTEMRQIGNFRYHVFDVQYSAFATHCPE